MPSVGPRIVIAGTHSGVGKTTVATGVMAALARRGLAVAPAKVGPDFIDPGYHSLAAGRPGRNLDPWMCGTAAIGPLTARAGDGCDVVVVEGVMGLFDGAADPDGPAATTAQVASLLDAPVMLVVDASSMSGSVAALVHGFVSFDPSVHVAGIVLNRVGSDSHEAMLRGALLPLDIPVLGCLRRDDRLTWRDRHLGLVPVVEQRRAVTESIELLAKVVEERCDVDAMLQVARAAPPLRVAPAPTASHQASVRVAVAAGPAFSFTYPDNLELLEQAGAELVPFDPRTDTGLPEATDALLAGGGFPEVFAAELSANRPLLEDVGHHVQGGRAVWAECGGVLWLARSLDGRPMAGAIPADARMTDRLTLGYRKAELRAASPLGPAGTALRGHEFHYSHLDPPGEGFDWSGRAGLGRGGYVTPMLLASYLHLHLGSTPELAERFVAAASKVRGAAVNGKPV